MRDCETLEQSYKLCEELGRGRFGVVYRCYSFAAEEFFACKSIHKPSLSLDPIDRRCIDVEPKILSLLSGCPNILNLHAVYEDDEYVHIVTDLCEGGDLYDRLSCGERFSEEEAAVVFKQLMVAIACCHRIGVAHRDIKPDNVLFDSRGRVILADFGSAELFEVTEMTGIVGTPYYVAPEVLMGFDYTEKVDVWSAGVILYIMLAGVAPFYGEGPADIFQAVLRGNLRFPPSIFRSVSPEAKDLLRKMMCKDVSRRLSAEQVLSEYSILFFQFSFLLFSILKTGNSIFRASMADINGPSNIKQQGVIHKQMKRAIANQQKVNREQEDKQAMELEPLDLLSVCS